MISTRHECLYGRNHPHTSGDGKAKRKFCAYCKGPMTEYRGTWGVFDWRGDGRYRLDDALSTHVRKSSADKATADSDTAVVRWIS